MADEQHPARSAEEEEDVETSSVEEELDEETTRTLKDFEVLLERSSQFILRSGLRHYPTQANLLESLGKTIQCQVELVKHAKGCRVICHALLHSFIGQFLSVKCEFGTEKEKNLYAGKDALWFVRRVIEKRPLVFFTSHDITLLRDGTSPSPKDWRKVGFDEEGAITLDEYMTYDELQISALVGTAVPTRFINSGDRRNGGVPASPTSFIPYGIYIGLVGARFEKNDCMESCHILIQNDTCTEAHGYGKTPTCENRMVVELLRLWAAFYKHSPHCDGIYYFPTYTEVAQLLQEDPHRYSKIYFEHKPSKWVDKKYINIPVYKSRLMLSILPFLEEANDRAKEAGTQAYCHVVGLGLGVWQVSNSQPLWMLEVYESILHKYPLHHISNINFSWFPDDYQKLPSGLENGSILESACGNRVKMEFSKRNPASPLTGEDQHKLLVAMYAWDGNSYPGNEYWRGMLGASGDPAAACCSAIPELQNPDVNPHLTGNEPRFWGSPHEGMEEVKEEKKEAKVEEEAKEEGGEEEGESKGARQAAKEALKEAMEEVKETVKEVVTEVKEHVLGAVDTAKLVQDMVEDKGEESPSDFRKEEHRVTDMQEEYSKPHGEGKPADHHGGEDAGTAGATTGDVDMEGDSPPSGQ